MTMVMIPRGAFDVSRVGKHQPVQNLPKAEMSFWCRFAGVFIPPLYLSNVLQLA